MEVAPTDVGPPHSFMERMVGAAKLDVDIYEEVEADKNATGQAFLVVLLSSLASGIGSGIVWLIANRSDYTVVGFVGNLVGGIAAAFAFFLVFSLLTYIVGSTIFKGPETEADWGQLIRTLGFSTTPGLLRIMPIVGLIDLAAFVWMVIAGVIAVRQALDFTTGRAIATCLVCILPAFAVWVIARIILAVFVG